MSVVTIAVLVKQPASMMDEMECLLFSGKFHSEIESNTNCLVVLVFQVDTLG